MLVVALLGALAWANLDHHGYASFWSTRVAQRSAAFPRSLATLGDVVDNGLMTVFFLAIGLEIGREVAEGSLRDRRNVLLPAVAALGGMAGAALVYLAAITIIDPHGHAAKGWGIPMATDVAFTLGALALLGPRVPRPLRVFVLALAVADDVGAVVVLALVASTKIHLLWLAGGVLSLGGVFGLRRRVRHLWWPYLVAAVITWYLFARAGIEPTLAGAFVGLLIPVAGAARAGRTLETPVHLLSSYAVLPVFVVANAGVSLTGAVWHSSGAVSVLSSLVAARILGKMAGITLAVAVLVRLGVCGLPVGTTWRHIAGVSLLCGMGITVPLLFAQALFGTTPALFTGAQLGLLVGTVGAAALGGGALFGARATVPPADAAPTAPAVDHEEKEVEGHADPTD